MEQDNNNNNNNNNNNKDNIDSNNIVIHWNNIVGQEARSIDNADLGKAQGLFEPFIVTERGTINKEKFYIPKSLIVRYNDEILYFDITEEQANDYCMRTTPPSEDEAKGIVQILSERRRPREDEGKKNEEETEIVPVREEKQEGKGTKMLEKIPLTTTLSKVDINEEEIANKLKAAASEFKNLIISGTKVAKQKIKQTQEIVEKKQANRDAETISKMGSLATQFTNSFDDILSDIKTRTYEEQEEIYTGFIKLIEQQRDLLIARRDLAAKLKESIRRPVVGSVATESPALEKKQQLEPELPVKQDPQLPEIIAATTADTGQDELKNEPQTITAAERESPEQITSPVANTESSMKKQKIGRSSSTNTTTAAKAKSSRIKKKSK